MEFSKLIPELSVSDIKKSLDFYTKVLGFKVEYTRVEDKFYFLSINEAQMMIEEINNHWNVGKLEQPFGRGINFQIEVENIEPILERLKETGTPLFRDPKESWYKGEGVEFGQREFLVQDPDGYLLRFIQDIGERPVQ